MRIRENGFPVDTGRKLNVHKLCTFSLMYVQFTPCVYEVHRF